MAVSLPRLAIVLVAVVTLGACHGPATPQATGQPSHATTASPQVKTGASDPNPCDLVTSADLLQVGIVGTAVEGSGARSNITPPRRDCVYDANGRASILISVITNTTSKYWDDQVALYTGPQNIGYQKVTGVGDDAFYGGQLGLFMCRKGTTIVLVNLELGLTAEAKSKTQQLALGALAKL